MVLALLVMANSVYNISIVESNPKLKDIKKKENLFFMEK